MTLIWLNSLTTSHWRVYGTCSWAQQWSKCNFKTPTCVLISSWINSSITKLACASERIKSKKYLNSRNAHTKTLFVIPLTKCMFNLKACFTSKQCFNWCRRYSVHKWKLSLNKSHSENMRRYCLINWHFTTFLINIFSSISFPSKLTNPRELKKINKFSTLSNNTLYGI